MIGFLFSGPSATGKSTVARIIGQELGLPVLGEREILRQISRECGFSRTRDWALTVGIEKVMDMVLDRTIKAIAEHTSTSSVF